MENIDDNDVVYEEVAIEHIRTIIDDLTECGIPILRKNKEEKYVVFPEEQISILLESDKYENIKLYLPKNYKEIMNSRMTIGKVSYSFKTPEEAEKEMNERMAEVHQMPYQQKVDTLKSYNKKLEALGKTPKVTHKVAQDITDISNDLGIINKINMFESIQKLKTQQIDIEELKKSNEAITTQTIELVTTISNILIQNLETQKVFDELRHYSDGGVMAHSNRVFITYINFLNYYNSMINNSSAFIHKVRTTFADKYKNYYDRVLKTYNINDETKNIIYKEFTTIEQCIDRGMRSLPESDLYLYAVGALLHDIGKVKDLNYFESATGRDTERIEQHLFNSYALVTKTGEYPLEVILTLAFHHEYYGLGYGPFSTFYKDKKEKDSKFRISSILTYDAKNSDRCDALAYIPSKMLEIVDVYDALIDPARKYRPGGKVFTNKEAVKIMKTEFIENHVKLDPVLFDTFINFLSHTTEEDLSMYHVE